MAARGSQARGAQATPQNSSGLGCAAPRGLVGFPAIVALIEDPTASPFDIDALRILDELPVAIFHATDERIDYANREFVRMSGRDKADVLGRDAFEAIIPEGREAARERFKARKRGESGVPARYEVEVKRPDGLRLRVDVEPRVVGERELLVTLRDVSTEVRDRSMLARLSELGLEIQRCRTVDQVLRTASAGLNALGLHVAVGRRQGERTVYEHVAVAGEFGPQLDQSLGRSLSGASFDTASLPLFAEAERERKVVYRDDAIPYLMNLARSLRPGVDEATLAQALAAHGFSSCMICPLVVDGALWGYLGVGSGEFTAADAAALGLFSSKVSTALEIAGTLSRLEQRNRELAAAQQVAAAGAETSLQGVLDRLVKVAEDSLCSEAVAVYLLDPKGHALELAATNERGRAIGEHFSRYALASAEDARAFHGLETQRLDVQRDLPGPGGEFLVGAGARYVVTLPMHIKGRLAGGLALGRSSRPYCDDEVRSAEFLASQMAVQLENARLFADAGRRLKLLEVLFDVSQMGKGALDLATLVDRVLQHALGALSVDGAAIYVIEGDRLVLAGLRGQMPHQPEKVRSLPLDRSNAPGRAVLERRTQFIESQGFAAMAPLISNDRPQGVLVAARRGASRFGPEEEQLLEALAAQVGSALEQVRAFEDERRRLEDFRLFVEVGRVVTASLDLGQILEASAVSLARIAEAGHCTILLLDPARRFLVGAATSVPQSAPAIGEIRLPVAEGGSVVEAMLQARPVRVDQLPASALHHELAARFGVRSLLALPLTVREQAIGAVVLTDDRPREWTDAQAERARAVAGQIAVAVANARLYEDLKASYEKLATAQAELVKRERLAALGELSAVVAHEVRNPLGVIFNSLRSLSRVLKPQGDAKMLLDIVGEEADRLNRIVGDLLDFARPSEPTLQPEPLGAVLESVVDSARAVAAAAGVQLSLQSLAPLPKAPVDARMVRQAVLNLVINAVQAMPRGGAVTIGVHAHTAADGGVRVHIEVEDTGPGVPPELAERIFEPFFTTKAAGTGLGLAVVKRIAEAHRGEVRLEPSPPGKGARFVLVLPLTPGPSPRR
ncbi:MAG TPA: GAF domain-containing protein [Myxococcales bacterium]|jgi:PAS domain S-box-containing protein